MELFSLIRLKDWLKNIIIFFPLIFSGYLFDTSNYIKLIICFLSFSIVSSLIYVLNDILDIKQDKKHPKKKITKPLASGKVSIISAYIVLTILIFISCILFYYFPVIRYHIFLYLILSLSYNFYLKKIPYLELLILSLGYLIRIDNGSVIINVESSTLMLSCIFFLGVYFIMKKRIAELYLNDSNLDIETRYVLKFYDKILLKYLSVVSILLVLSILIIYISTINIKLLLSAMFITIFLYRYNLLTNKNSFGENPISLILKEKSLFVLANLALISSLIIYV